MIRGLISKIRMPTPRKEALNLVSDKMMSAIPAATDQTAAAVPSSIWRLPKRQPGSRNYPSRSAPEIVTTSDERPRRLAARAPVPGP